MNVTEFSNEFDLLYNQIASVTATNIDSYEKSVIFTQAQEEIVRELYSGTTPTGISFEETEKLRRRLGELVIPKSTDYDETLNTDLASIQISTDSKFFEVESDIWFILEEAVFVDTLELMVIPKTLDEYQRNRLNPFQKPNLRKAWRMDVKNTIDSTDVVEIVSNQTLTKYNYRYLKQPEPIILVDLDTVYPDQDLTINGANTITECTLAEELHRIILLRAVNIAEAAYNKRSPERSIRLQQNRDS